MTTIPTLELRGVDKSFGPVHVLSSVNFTAKAGEVTALVGDNGAGKTTLVKCIGGIHRVDAGELIFDGTPRSINGPRDAALLGVEIVYQDLALCDNLDIVDNMFLGREEVTRLHTLDENSMEKLAQKALASLSVRTVRSVRQLVASLSGGQRQTVAIAKSVLWKSKIVILDEPTAALGVAQTEQVLDLVRRLAGAGRGRDPRIAQHERRHEGRRLHRRALPGPDGGTGQTPGRDPDSGGRADHRGPLG